MDGDGESAADLRTGTGTGTGTGEKGTVLEVEVARGLSRRRGGR